MDAPVSRQPACRYCEHEEHVHTRCHAELTRSPAAADDGELSMPLLCPCPPHQPNGIYPRRTA
jgi:hypothetical protein